MPAELTARERVPTGDEGSFPRRCSLRACTLVHGRRVRACPRESSTGICTRDLGDASVALPSREEESHQRDGRGLGHRPRRGAMNVTPTRTARLSYGGRAQDGLPACHRGRVRRRDDAEDEHQRKGQHEERRKERQPRRAASRRRSASCGGARRAPRPSEGAPPGNRHRRGTPFLM